MRKIPSVFQRNYDTDRLIRDEVVPGCEWVLQGEGVATVKFDGSCCCIKDGRYYKRYELKRGRKEPPAGFIAAQDPDPVTGDVPGWLRVGSGPEDKWFVEALLNTMDGHGGHLEDGTFEAMGPHFQGNPEGLTKDALWRHGSHTIDGFLRTFDGIRLLLEYYDIEGIVFHHPDGRMAKVKKKDFGLKR